MSRRTQRIKDNSQPSLYLRRVSLFLVIYRSPDGKIIEATIACEDRQSVSLWAGQRGIAPQDWVAELIH